MNHNSNRIWLMIIHVGVMLNYAANATWVFFPGRGGAFYREGLTMSYSPWECFGVVNLFIYLECREYIILITGCCSVLDFGFFLVFYNFFTIECSLLKNVTSLGQNR